MKEIMRRGRLGFGSLLLAVLLASCQPSAPEIELQPIPAPDISAAEKTVQEQISEKSEAIRVLLDDSEASAKAKAEAFGELGQIYVAYDFLAAAEVCFDNAQRLQPEDFRWVYLGGYLNQIQGQVSEAVTRMKTALELQDDYLPAWLRLGRAHLEGGEVELAQATFEKALELDENAAAAHEGLGKIAEAQGDLDTAVASFERALEIQPRASGLRYALGQLYRRQGDLERARAELAESGDVAIAIQDPLLNPLGQLAASAQFYIMRAGEAMEVQDFPTASAAYRQALELDTSLFDAYKGLAYSLEKQGDLEGAIRELERGIVAGKIEDPEQDRLAQGGLHRILGGLKALSGRDQEAIQSFTQAIENHPGDENARLKLANALARQGEFATAMSHYDQLLEERPELAMVRVMRATALINLQRPDEALKDFEQAVQDAPGNPQFRMRYADALDFLGRRSEARKQREQASQLALEGSEKARALIAEGRRLVREGNYEEALGTFNQAMEESPDALEARFQAASVLGHLERYDEALTAFRELLEANPRHQAARHGEVTSLLLARRYGEARVRLNEAMQLFPRDFQLAHTQARLMATVPDPRVRDGRFALAVAQKLYEFKSDDLDVRCTLAMALAENGQFEQATQLQRRSIQQARDRGLSQFLPTLEGQLSAYEARQAWTFQNPEELVGVTLRTP